MKFNINLNMDITWSKLFALFLLIVALILDIKNGLPGTVSMFCVPFEIFLITGKQVIDWRKKRDEIKNGK